jgi:thiamine biosynthesis lipoprotein
MEMGSIPTGSERFLRPVSCLTAAAVAGVLLALLGCRSRYAPVTTAETRFFNAPVILHMATDEAELLLRGAGLAMAEIRRLEQTFHPDNTDGSLYRLNSQRQSDDAELFRLLERAQTVSEMTGGSFSLFTGYLERAYGFQQVTPQPPQEEILREILLPLHRAEIEFNTEDVEVRIPNDAYSVSLTWVREGYAADQGLAQLSYAGLRDAMVQVGWHYACGGSPNDLGWRIDVRDPRTDELVVSLYAQDCGVATCSERDQAFIYRNEVYYNHLDPETGQPARLLSSATVIAPNSELAGELAHSVFIMGSERGLQLLNELPGTDGILIDQEGRVSRSDSLFIWIGG